MLNVELIKQLLIDAIALSVITCAFIQETKKMFKTSKYITLYSFVVNMALGIAFCLSFTDVNIYLSPWVGLFSFIGADTLYKSLEGKLTSHKDIVKEEIEEIPRGDK